MTKTNSTPIEAGPIEPLIEDISLLTQYARERGLVPGIVGQTQQLLNKQKTQPLTNADLTAITRHYEALSQAVGAVTPKTLRATTNVDKGYWKSAAGRHLIKLWSFTLLAALFILLYSLLDYRLEIFALAPGETPDESQYMWFRLQYIAQYLVPFTYGALGACAYLLRISAAKLRTREFNPDRIPEHWNRLVLGTLSGGVIVLFIHQPEGIAVAEGALGFLAGYSIDFLFQTLDRVIAAILPKTGLDTVARRLEQRKRSLLVNRYQQALAKAKSPEAKKLLTEIIDDLQE